MYQNSGSSSFSYYFLKTKPRLSQAGALSYHKDLVSLWYKTNYMAKVHFRDYNPKQIILFPQRLDKDIATNVYTEIQQDFQRLFLLPYK